MNVSNSFHICYTCTLKQSCCRETKPPITRKRRKIIERYLNKNNIGITNPFEKTDYVFPKIQVDGFCIFFHRKSKKCLVHEVKPETCIAGPITFDINFQTRIIEWYIKSPKICPLVNQLNDNIEEMETRLKLAKNALKNFFRDVEMEDLRSILEIEEPDTVKIDEEPLDEDIFEKLE